MVNKNRSNQWGANDEPTDQNDQWGSGNPRSTSQNDQWGSPQPTSGKQPEDQTQVFPRQSPGESAARRSANTQRAPGSASQQKPKAMEETETNTKPPAQAGRSATGKPSKSRIIVAVVLILALAAAAVGGWYFTQRDDSAEETEASTEATAAEAPPQASESSATASTSASSTSANPSTESKGTDKGSCDPASAMTDARRPVKMYCDGQWMLAGEWSTSNIDLFYWTGEEWGTYSFDGRLRDGAQGECYSYGKLKDALIPAKLMDTLLEKHLLCPESARMNSDEDNSTGSSQSTNSSSNNDRTSGWLPVAKCDGRYVVIVDSVLVYPGQEARPFVNTSLAANPGASATSPGACGSFRASVDGADVYPVYYDYGNDRTGACTAEARGEGNARKLQYTVDYSSPC